MRTLLLSAVLISSLSAGAAPLLSATTLADAPDISVLTSKLQIENDTAVPGAVLKSGTYVIRIVDRLADRSIVRVESDSGKVISTFLAVPNRSLAGYGGQGPVVWTGGSDHDKALRGFNFAGYSAEFVYPKAEAVKLAVGHSAAVEAIDPPSDNLPSKEKNLTNDDMRIVTLWTLSPTRVNGTTAIAAEKYKPVEPAPAAEPVVARNEPPAGLPEPPSTPATEQPTAEQPAASASRPAADETPARAVAHAAPKASSRRPVAATLPHTASELPSILLTGVASLIGVAGLRTRRRFLQN